MILELARYTIFFLLCAASGFGLSRLADWCTLSGAEREELMSGLSFLLGILNAVTIRLAYNWKECSPGVTLRANGRERVRRLTRTRTRNVMLRLIIGVLGAVGLKVSGVLLVDDKQIMSPVWSVVGFTFLTVTGVCLIISLVDLRQFLDLGQQLKTRSEQLEQKAKSLDSLQNSDTET